MVAIGVGVGAAGAVGGTVTGTVAVMVAVWFEGGVAVVVGVVVVGAGEE